LSKRRSVGEKKKDAGRELGEHPKGRTNHDPFQGRTCVCLKEVFLSKRTAWWLVPGKEKARHGEGGVRGGRKDNSIAEEKGL